MADLEVRKFGKTTVYRNLGPGDTVDVPEGAKLTIVGDDGSRTKAPAGAKGGPWRVK